MSCDNLYCNFGASEYGASMERRVLSEFIRYESKVLQAGLGVDHCSIDYLTPAVLYLADGTGKNLTYLGGW